MTSNLRPVLTRPPAIDDERIDLMVQLSSDGSTRMSALSVKIQSQREALAALREDCLTSKDIISTEDVPLSALERATLMTEEDNGDIITEWEDKKEIEKVRSIGTACASLLALPCFVHTALCIFAL